MKFLPVFVVTALEFGLLFVLFNWQNKLYHPTYVSFGVLLFVFWLGLNGTLYEGYLKRKKGYRVIVSDEEKGIIYREGKNKLKLSSTYIDNDEENLPIEEIQIPSEQQWRQLMPEWAKEHRTRIINNIKADLDAEVFRFVDCDVDETT